MQGTKPSGSPICCSGLRPFHLTMLRGAARNGLTRTHSHSRPQGRYERTARIECRTGATGNLFPLGYRGCQNLLGLGMPKNRPPPLTNVQISAMFKDLNGTVTNLVLSVAVIHDLLVSKEYVTKSEVSATSERIRAEAKDALAKMHKAHRRAPDQENH